MADFSTRFGDFAVHVEAGALHGDSFFHDGVVGVSILASEYVEHDCCWHNHFYIFGGTHEAEDREQLSFVL